MNQIHQFTNVLHGARTHGHGWMRTCGQAAIATAAGVTLEEAVKAVGHRSCTTYDDLRRGLFALGLIPQRRRIGSPSFYDPRPYTAAIARCKHADGASHWVFWYDGTVFDSVRYQPNSQHDFLLHTGYVFTSHMRITFPQREPEGTRFTVEQLSQIQQDEQENTVRFETIP